MTFLVAALPSEAKPLVEFFGLRLADSGSPFRVYGGNGLTLIVSGVGRAASAAATAYAFARAGEPRGRAWINVGIAGHRDAEIGSCWLATKIREPSSDRSWYPGLAFSAGIPGAEVVTVDRPEGLFERAALYDMEASAFFATASRFSPVELIQVFKVVSDNRDQPARGLDAAKVSRLIAERTEELAGLVRRIGELEADLTGRSVESPDLAPWLGERHFTFSQRRQLGELLRRLEVLEGEPVEACAAALGAPDARALLRSLEERLRRQGVGF